MADNSRSGKLAVILHADVAGSTALVQQDEQVAHGRIQNTFRCFGDTITKYRGHVRELRGDALLAEFERASDAVTAALAFQAEQIDYNAQLNDSLQPKVRVGIAMGEVIVADDTITGAGVVLAQRLEQLSEPGGVVIQGAAYETIPGRFPFEYANLGEHQVKGFDEPVRAYSAGLKRDRDIPQPSPLVHKTRNAKIAFVSVAVIITGIALMWFKPWGVREEPASMARMAFPLPDKPSIAVLPFTNMSDDAQQEYFVDGMTEDLITDLSKLSGLFVVARNSVFTYKGKPVKVQQVAEELGVRYVLEGSVRRVGGLVRINAQLIDATTGGHVWAERYDGSLTDVFTLQDKVARNIVAALAVSMTDEEQVQRSRQDTDNADAYDAFLQGWAHYQLRTPEDLAKAVPYLEEAIRLDSNYARAHAALASVYWDAWNNNWVKSLNVESFQARRLMAEHLKEALKSPTSLAHSLKSRILAEITQKYEEAVSEAQQALTLDTNDATAYAALANALIFAGRPAEGADSVRKAMRLDPHYPPSYLIILGRTEFELEQFEEAAETFERAVKRNLDNKWAWIYLAATYGHLGREKEGQLAMETFNVFRAEAELPEVNVSTIKLTRFGGDMAQKRMMSGLSVIPPPTWKTLFGSSDSGETTVQGATAIDINMAKTLHDRGVRFVDVRRDGSWLRAHIPSAFSLPLVRNSKARLGEIVDRKEDVVLYCNCGRGCNMSPEASAKAVAWGYQNVYFIKGAIDAWDAAEYPLEQGE